MKCHYTILLSIILLSACSGKKAVSAASAGKPAQGLVITTTTDFHAALDRAESMAAVLRRLKEKYGDRMLYLDAGDLFQGSIEGNQSKGRSIVDFYNLLPIDAAAIGN